jgi:pantothenate kinase
MSVGDIYGGDYDAFGLDQNLIASSCAKLRNGAEHQDADIARSVLTMFCFNLTQIVYLTA